MKKVIVEVTEEEIEALSKLHSIYGIVIKHTEKKFTKEEQTSMKDWNIAVNNLLNRIKNIKYEQTHICH